ncbi:hypothetical protein [Oricola nitratireducens]|jgi:hypothetical protein|uniref:hypothetical protein n=1 Tax=Oricola nitratireducens TaxID=2775868 RepID=UPI0018676533|nr:hypothetical protein [Oricola nitratireducens]
MPPTIKPTINDPHCLDFLRMPDGMIDPVYDGAAMDAHAGRDAANFVHCHEACAKKSCRKARACLADGTISGKGACVSPRWDARTQLLAVYLTVHAINIRERHRAWDIARKLGADLPVPEPWPTEEEMAGDDGERPRSRPAEDGGCNPARPPSSARRPAGSPEAPPSPLASLSDRQ